MNFSPWINCAQSHQITTLAMFLFHSYPFGAIRSRIHLIHSVISHSAREQTFQFNLAKNSEGSKSIDGFVNFLFYIIDIHFVKFSSFPWNLSFISSLVIKKIWWIYTKNFILNWLIENKKRVFEWRDVSFTFFRWNKWFFFSIFRLTFFFLLSSMFKHFHSFVCMCNINSCWKFDLMNAISFWY